MSLEVEGEEVRPSEPAQPDYHSDLGNLLVYDPSHPGISHLSSGEDRDRQCLEAGKTLLHALVEKLFNLPSSVDKVGRLVNLPPPITRLPREKPLPKPRPLTKWEIFAKEKGIIKRKRSKLEFDEMSQEWKRRHGYKRVADINDIPVIEAKPSDEPGEDPFSKMQKGKQDLIAKHENNRLQNLKKAAKFGGKAALPSTLQLAATAFPITGAKGTVMKFKKDDIGQAVGLARTATASGGKFDQKVPGERASKHPGKHRKFLPVVEGKGLGSEEKIQSDRVLNKVLARHNYDILDVNKAVSVYTAEEESKRAKEHRKEGHKQKQGHRKDKHQRREQNRRPGKKPYISQKGKRSAVRGNDR